MPDRIPSDIQNARTLGQSLIELLVGLPLILGIFLAVANAFRTQWDRVHCAHEVFEIAHRALIRSEASLNSSVRVRIDENGVIAEGRCGKLTERVRLPTLEKARW